MISWSPRWPNPLKIAEITDEHIFFDNDATKVIENYMKFKIIRSIRNSKLSKIE